MAFRCTRRWLKAGILISVLAWTTTFDVCCARQHEVEVLTSVERVRRLSPRECRTGRPVKITGEATQIGEDSFVLNDGTGGLRFEYAGARAELSTGLVYEATGETTFGLAAPLVRGTRFRRSPRRVTALTVPVAPDQVFGGGWDDQQVEVTVLVTRVLRDSLSEGLEAEAGGRRLTVLMEGLDDSDERRHRGKRMRVTGTVRGRYSASGRLISPDIVGVDAQDTPQMQDRPPAQSVAVAAAVTTAAAIKRQAVTGGRRVPVSVRGVITYADESRFLYFVQDSTAGIYFTKPDPWPDGGIRPGMLVEVSGYRGRGRFAPIIENTRIRVLGKAGMPSPKSLEPDQVVSGKYDSEWVQVEGWVRGAELNRDSTVLVVKCSQERLQVLLPAAKGGVLDYLRGAKVLVRGVYGVVLNERRQLVGVRILVPGWDWVRVTKRLPLDETATPQSIESLRRYTLADDENRHRRVSGTVTAVIDDSFILQDESGGARIYPAQKQSISVGDRLDVVGHVATRRWQPVVEDAEVRADGKGSVAASEMIPADALAGQFHDQLVHTEGYLVDVNSVPGGRALLLRSGPSLFTARWPGASDTAFEGLSRGDLVDVTGVCLPSLRMNTRYSSTGIETDSFEILMRSAQDVRILAKASWWTLGRTLLVLTGMTAVVLLTLVWVWMLGRRVRQQTATITRQLEREAALKVTAEAASRAKSEFLANMSHEIRTPLHGILGMAELALQAPPGREQKGYIEAVQNCGASLLSVVNDILDISKIEAGRLQLQIRPFSLRAVVEGVASLMEATAAQQGLRLKYEIAPGTPDDVSGDAERLRQVLLNLVGNAVKFTPQGEVEVRACQERVDGTSAVLRFSVSDTGIGIPEDKLEQVFGAFEQVDGSNSRRFGGTGLGLAICRELVQLMGGRIWAESRLGEGSTFHFTVQLARDSGSADRADAPRSRDEREVRPLRVLLAEDNAVNQRLASRLLQKQGHFVSTVCNGLEALQAVENGGYDAILMDVQMPVMDGLDATRRIRERERANGGHVPIIALTARAMKGDAELCSEAGMDAFLSKPVHGEDLLRVLAAVSQTD